MLNFEQHTRYSRHLRLEDFGTEGQERLLRGKVLLIGAGGLGSPCALYLAASGVGTIGIVDGDFVSLNNLQRQVIHFSDDLGKKKVCSASEKISRINPDVKVDTYPTFLTQDNALDIIAPYDFVIDCTDTFASKYLVNDACVMAGKAFCCGGVLKWGGHVMTHVPGTACYRCLFPEPPERSQVETCSTVGVLSPAVGIMGTIQACEALKYLAQTGQLLTNSLLTFDARSMEFMHMEFDKNEDCPLCGKNPAITELQEYAFMPCKK